MKKSIPYLKTIILVTLVYLISITILLISPLEIDAPDLILDGLFAYFAFICLIITWRLSNISLCLGWLFLSSSLLMDALDELKFIEITEWQDIVFEKLFFGIGFILVIYGFHYCLSQRNTMLQKLDNIAHFNALTMLPNKRLHKSEFERIIREASSSNEKVGVLFLNLDKFNLINNTFGHSIGDELLKQVAQRLKPLVRDGDSLSHLSGDEFSIIYSNLSYRGTINDLAKEVLNTFLYPFLLDGKQIHVSCSVGATLYPEHGTDIENLFSNADMAVHKAKANGGNQYSIFNEEMQKQSQKKLFIKESLKQALVRKEFILHYQPKVNIHTGNVTGLEALVRWQRSDGKLIYPNDFIDIAEETGIIKDIDLNVFEIACLQIKQWMNHDITPFNISVNISAKLLSTLNFMERVDDILNRVNIDTSYLCVEITETEGIKDIYYVNSVLKQLKEKNIIIALDDYGTGYASLNYLKKFPIDILKIDKALIDGIAKDERDKTLLNAAIAMSKTLNIKVVCEGVETIEQLNILKNIGCDEYQGYYYSKPLPIDLIEKNLGI